MSYYKIQNFEQYFKHYNKSVREPRKFWGKIAEENFTWYQLWDKVVELIWLKQKLSGLPKQN
jgi:acetyl-CoA synthetase